MVPQLYHTSADLRYLKGFGSFKNPMDVPFEVYKEQLRDYLDFLHGNGVRWVLPYLCNQTIEGNDRLRTVAWEVYDRWEEFQSLGLGPKPPDLYCSTEDNTCQCANRQSRCLQHRKSYKSTGQEQIAGERGGERRRRRREGISKLALLAQPSWLSQVGSANCDG